MDAAGVITAMAISLFGVAVALRLLPVGTCPECSHCRLERLRHQEETEARSAQIFGIPRCSACGRYHDPSEDHPA